ncbi:hypothetical protein GCM10023322_66970 [Rugosimonospora acidiphila]|uniref:Uncharacterized protein n=1 Tax=Rugosimonospora acidiphila TaxID=556531 RepID=A0ABP9SIE3_9ACTN
MRSNNAGRRPILGPESGRARDPEPPPALDAEPPAAGDPESGRAALRRIPDRLTIHRGYPPGGRVPPGRGTTPARSGPP